jgi:cytochrome c553
MYKKTILVLAGLAGIALSGMASATDVHTRTIASTCMSCHGPNGKSVGAAPGLAGITQDKFVDMMKGYKAGTRKGTIMKKHAAGYTDAEYAAMGAYFASLK